MDLSSKICIHNPLDYGATKQYTFHFIALLIIASHLAVLDPEKKVWTAYFPY